MESGGASPYPQTATPQSGLETDIPIAQRKRKICVYCGSSAGKKPEHLEAARQLAKVMADNNIGLGESSLDPVLLPHLLHPLCKQGKETREAIGVSIANCSHSQFTAAAPLA